MGSVRLLLALLAAFAGPGGNAFAQPVTPPTRRQVLIVIGYADEARAVSLESIFSRPHHNEIAHYTDQMIRELLRMLGTRGSGPDQYETKGARFTILNSNVDCPGEDPRRMNPRSRICEAQIEHSKEIMEHLSSRLSDYDELIYIGHSRNGMGLGVGPYYSPDFTFRYQAYNEFERGKLQRVLLASCLSETYYGSSYRASGIDFAGSDTAELNWPSESLPLVFEEIQRILKESISRPSSF